MVVATLFPGKPTSARGGDSVLTARSVKDTLEPGEAALRRSRVGQWLPGLVPGCPLIRVFCQWADRFGGLLRRYGRVITL